MKPLACQEVPAAPRGGHRSAPAVPGEADYLTMIFGNITKMGPQALRFVYQLQPSVQMAGFVETHVPAESLLRWKTDLLAAGWRMFAAPAVLTGKSSNDAIANSGGAWILVRTHVCTTSFDVLKDSKPLSALGEFATPPLDDSFTATTVHLQGGTVTVVVLYLETSIKLKGRNLCRLQRRGAFLISISGPWLVMADWNVSPPELIASGFPDAVGG